MADVRIAVAICMMVIFAFPIEGMTPFTRARRIVVAFTEEWIAPTVPDPAWAVKGGESP